MKYVEYVVYFPKMDELLVLKSRPIRAKYGSEASLNIVDQMGKVVLRLGDCIFLGKLL